MTRYKKYVREKGFKLEEDYPAIPWPIGNGHVTIQAVELVLTSKGIVVCEHYDTISTYMFIGRDGSATEIFK